MEGDFSKKGERHEQTQRLSGHVGTNPAGYGGQAMMKHFHEDVIAVPYGDLTPIEHNINGLDSRIRKAQRLLLKDSYQHGVNIDSPMWYLDMAIQDIEQAKKASKKTCKN